VARDVDMNRFGFAHQFEAHPNSFALRVDSQLGHFSNAAQLRVNCNPCSESDGGVFGALKKVSHTDLATPGALSIQRRPGLPDEFWSEQVYRGYAAATARVGRSSGRTNLTGDCLVVERRAAGLDDWLGRKPKSAHRASDALSWV